MASNAPATNRSVADPALAGPPLAGTGNPFSRLVVALMLLVGIVGFIGMLYAIGLGNAARSSDTGQAHAGSRSLVGYAGLVDLLERTGAQVEIGRDIERATMLDGLLVLTPDERADPVAMQRLIREQLRQGPVLIILPKWYVSQGDDTQDGWTDLVAANAADFGQALLSGLVRFEVANQSGLDVTTPQGRAAALDSQVTMSGDGFTALIRDGDGAMLVGETFDLLPVGEDEVPVGPPIFPLIIAADADMFNNMGMADEETAREALQIFAQIRADNDAYAIRFDLTQNGLGRSANLLTEVFKPPFLGATVALLLAMLAAIWMAFNRFGPPLRTARAMGYGKQALVSNSAGFIRRMGREKLMAGAYARLMRQRSADAAGIRSNQSEQELDRALDAMGADGETGFSALADRLGLARTRNELTDRARALHDWKTDHV